MKIFKKNCAYCGESQYFWKRMCQDCDVLFDLVQKNLGKMGLSQLLDELIATKMPKPQIQKFLEANPYNQGSILDQILANLTNDLAKGMGVHEKQMKAQDVQQIRAHPKYGTSDKPIEE